MKKLLIGFVALVFTANFCVAQDYKSLKSVVLSSQEDCTQAEQKVLEVANFLLTSPCKKDVNTLYINDFLIDWLDKTDKYKFAVDAKFLKTIQQDVYLTARYYAALAKTALDAGFEISPKDLQVQAVSEFLRYSTTKSNRAVITPKLQKYVDAYKNNTLAAMIK
ncbi:MAG: hypothetical protein FWC39_04090 [Bacteroidetes bacterium]|nr:hypothetical protein [Bacteroidota bacterium]